MIATDRLILIVDDNPEDRATFRRYLSQGLWHGHEILEADCGEAGLELYFSRQPDCVLVDFNMPDLNGLEFLQRMSADHHNEFDAVVMVTGEGDEGVAVQAMKLGALDYLPKSRIDRDSLLRSVRYAIEQKDLQDQRREAEHRLKLVAEQLPALLWTTDLDGCFTLPSPHGLVNGPGGSRALIGQKLGDYFESVDASFPPIAAFLRACQGETMSFELPWKGRSLRLRTQPFRDNRQKIVGTISIGIDVTTQARMEHQLDAARHVQQLLLPHTTPQVPGFDIAGLMIPALQTAGDYYDFIPLPDNNWGLVVGDVSGKGLGAALIMVELRAYLRAHLESSIDLSLVLRRASRFLLRDFDAAQFVTLFFVRLNPQRRSVSYAGAGHDGFLLRASGAVVELSSTGMPLGLVDDLDIAASPLIPLEPGDLLVILTDGFNETMSAGKLLGMPRVLDMIQQLREQPAAQILASLDRLVREYAAGAPQQDDMTGVVIKCLS